MPCMKRVTIILSFVLIAISSKALAVDNCINWGKTMTMVHVGELQKASGKKTVLLQSFDDFTKVPGDDWLAYGIPSLLADYLSTGRDISVLFGTMSKYTSSAVSPNYIVNGMYQHTQNQLRIFIKLLDKRALVKQWQLNIPYPQNKQFFEMLGNASLDILALLSPHYENEQFKAVRMATPSVPAYMNYIKGALTYERFEPETYEIATTWFDESKKADINYMKAYIGQMDMDIFMALYNKQYKKPYSAYLEKAEKEWNAMNKFKMRTPLPDIPRKYMIKDKGKGRALTNRFLIGNGFFIAGLTEAGQKNYVGAASQFEFALAHVPEDAITWYYLSQMRDKTGNARQTADARVKAFEINRCLQ